MSAQRSKALDVLRAIAVLLVILHHLRAPEGVASSVAFAADVMRRGGWIGVDLFFVLSGYLVSGLIFEEYARTGGFRAFRFLGRRGLKIYPAFYVLFVVGAIFGVQLGLWRSPASWIGELFFLQNYVGAMWGHTWSLAVEEHFYLLLAASLALSVRLRPADPFSWVPVAFAIVAPVCLALRLLACATSSPPYVTHFATHFRIDSLLFGVLLRYVTYRFPERTRAMVGRYELLLWVVGILGLLPMFVSGPTDWSFAINSVGFTLLYVACGAILMATLHTPGITNPIGRALRDGLAAIGFRSYSIYLWHIVSLKLVGRLVPPGTTGDHVVYALASVAVAVGLGSAMAAIVEVPVLRIRDRVLA